MIQRKTTSIAVGAQHFAQLQKISQIESFAMVDTVRAMIDERAAQLGLEPVVVPRKGRKRKPEGDLQNCRLTVMLNDFYFEQAQTLARKYNLRFSAYARWSLLEMLDQCDVQSERKPVERLLDWEKLTGNKRNRVALLLTEDEFEKIRELAIRKQQKISKCGRVLLQKAIDAQLAEIAQ